MAWRGWELGMAGEPVRLMQDLLIRKYQWVRDNYPTLQATGLFDQTTQDALRDFQLRVGMFASGIADWKTQQRLGMFDVPAKKTVVFTIPGTWAGWNDGPPAWTAWSLDKSRFYQQGVGYPAMGFLTPNPNVSYEESRDAGVEETVRLIKLLPAGTPLVLIGYSQGAEVAVRTSADFLPGGRLADRRGDLKRIITFGSPSRPAGPTLVGNNPPGGGIAGFTTPVELKPICYDYVTNGDMYPCATNMLRFFYAILTKMELSVDFGVAALQILGSAVRGPQDKVLGGVLGGLFGNAFGGNSTGRVINAVAPKATDAQIGQLAALVSNAGDVAQTVKVALQFATTGAHMQYHTWPDFGGKTAVQHAIDGLNTARW